MKSENKDIFGIDTRLELPDMKPMFDLREEQEKPQIEVEEKPRRSRRHNIRKQKVNKPNAERQAKRQTSHKEEGKQKKQGIDTEDIKKFLKEVNYWVTLFALYAELAFWKLVKVIARKKQNRSKLTKAGKRIKRLKEKIEKFKKEKRQ